MLFVTHVRFSVCTLLLCLCLFAHNFHLEWLLSLRHKLRTSWLVSRFPGIGPVQNQITDTNTPTNSIVTGPFVAADWESWWTYEGISGPEFWGRLNPKWSQCSKGHRQSPIDISTKHLLYDPHLEPVRIHGEYARGSLINTGRGISLAVNPDKPVTISDGPFSYVYTLSNLSLHFGRENNRGSEHTIDEMQFPGELQLYAFNSQLYANWSEAKREPNGIAAISVFIVLAKNSNQANPALKHITNSLKNITRRGQTYTIDSISISELLPSKKHYVTYEGSLTQPACHETVQWVILNKPIYISPYQFHMLRHSLKGDGHQDNFRPTQPLNRRPLRANIVSDAVAAANAGTGADANENGANQRHQRSANNNNKRKLDFNNLDDFPLLDEPPFSVSSEVDSGSNQVDLNSKDNNMDNEQVSFAGKEVSPYLVDSNGDGDGFMDGANSNRINSNSNNANPDSIGLGQLSSSTVRDSICLPDQLRLYGYRANRKVNEEL